MTHHTLHTPVKKIAGIFASLFMISVSVASAQLIQMNLNNTYSNSGSLGGSGFEDESTTSTFTADGGGYTGQAGDRAWSRGAGGQGLAYGNFGNTRITYPALNNLTGATFAMWVKLPAATTGDRTVLGFEAAQNLSIYNEFGATGNTELTPGGWQTGNLGAMSDWTFLSMRWDGVAGTTLVDLGDLGGTLTRRFTQTGTFVGNTGLADWNVRWANALPAGTLLDNARFYSSALSDSALQSVYAADVAAIPEPSTWAMLATGLGALALLRWRKASRA